MARPKKVSILQANDATSYVNPKEVDRLTEEQIRDAAQPFIDRGARLEVTSDHWVLSIRKTVYDLKGRHMGSGDIKICGNFKMPIKDFLFSANELMIPITAPGLKD